jgi:type IV pilus assembly protein PilY1
VRVIDIQEANGVLVADEEKLADQIFVGDMGGQVWRFFINNGSSGAGLITPAGASGDGIFASVGGRATSSARRFYNEPDVALLNVNGSRSLTVNIGSGYRGHPLNEYITDRFYSFRTTSLFKGDSHKTLTESDLYDATANLVQKGSDTEVGTAKAAFASADGGWFITLTHSGEKVMSKALTIDGQLFFNTYEPSASTAACSASIGKNRSYSVFLMDATPTKTIVDVNGVSVPGDRDTPTNSGGIAGDPQLFCTGDDCWVLPDPSVDPVEVDMPPLGKTYWMDHTNIN